ncbi:MAG TPA: hypothetical protein IGS53_00185 [Leptolyngbyaceae cyanobacterium M33_DOE_097]|uniref:Uncharacterized protein n=1 Tax=Oscillatoriales cyanobacterium SpSt-418 TaxID=2282169 RepID=A0A7C3PDJ7_9CYAN|nr:hypothetical protein [Leptolyngbyaceae cyanobacterium M33_DOE_097]
MCFSASASFAASALLLPAGLYSVRLAALQNPKYIPLATIPIAFAAQQACEGLTWLGLMEGAVTVTNLGALGFLGFAYWFWLFWAPWSVAQLEPHPIIQRVSRSLSVIGLIYGSLLYLPLWIHPDWLEVDVFHHSIQYTTRLIFDLWFSQDFDRVIYALIILIPFFLASNHALRWFAGAIAVSALLSHWLLHQVFVSVWCFFAALLSGLIVLICQTTSTENSQQLL